MQRFYLILFASAILACQSDTNRQAGYDGKKTALIYDSAILDAAIIREMEAAIEKGDYPNIHSVVIAYENKVVYENYWKGQDESWGDNLGVIQHGRDSLHDIRSISKSIVSACVGIALEQGKIKSIDQRVFEFFPEYLKQDTGLKSALTIKHLLTMTSGLKWNEDVPYDNPENSEIQMIRAPDAIGYVLSQPMDIAPGKIWKYNGGTTQLLAAIIQKTTGKRIDSFANENLFIPLGFSSFEWVKYPGTQMPAAASGLRLTARDQLQFGLLYLNAGKNGGRQILPPAWVEQSLTAYINNDHNGSYGFQFWLWTDSVMNKALPIAACVGNGDQRIFIDKTNRLLVVVNAGNYNKWDIKKNSGAVVDDFVYPALFKKTK